MDESTELNLAANLIFSPVLFYSAKLRLRIIVQVIPVHLVGSHTDILILIAIGVFLAQDCEFLPGIASLVFSGSAFAYRALLNSPCSCPLRRTTRGLRFGSRL